MQDNYVYIIMHTYKIIMYTCKIFMYTFKIIIYILARWLCIHNHIIIFSHMSIFLMQSKHLCGDVPSRPSNYTVGLPQSTGESKWTACRQFLGPDFCRFRDYALWTAARRGTLRQSRWPPKKTGPYCSGGRSITLISCVFGEALYYGSVCHKRISVMVCKKSAYPNCSGRVITALEEL